MKNKLNQRSGITPAAIAAFGYYCQRKHFEVGATEIKK